MEQTTFPIPGQQTAVQLAGCFSAAPVLTQELAACSHALSAAAYTMDTAPWHERGWTDFSYLVDHKLMTGSKVNAAETDSVRGKISRLFTHAARSRIRRSNPLTQLYGTLRQKEKSDTCKALIMSHPLPDGRRLIAIGFMGTGKRFFDWISNFRLTREDHMHRGFLQLTEEFESRAPDIRFPHTAQAFGLDRLMLSDILAECTREGSRFLIWMSGHSQGGAVMQIFTHHLLEAGVLPQNLLGVGFASPTVAHNIPISHRLYPLHHLICQDDVTPRVGARWHFGTCHVLPMTLSLRQACYPENTRLSHCALLPLLSRLTDTRTALLFAMGFLRALGHMSDREADAVLRSLTDISVPLPLADWLGDGVNRILQSLQRRLIRSYRSMTGESGPPVDAVIGWEQELLHQIHQYGPAVFAAMLAGALASPHHLNRKKDRGSAYAAMVSDAFAHLRPMIRLPGAWPVAARPVHTERKSIRSRYLTLTKLKQSRR